MEKIGMAPNTNFTTSYTLTPEQLERFNETARRNGYTAGDNATFSEKIELDRLAGSIITEDNKKLPSTPVKTQSSSGTPAQNPILGAQIASGNETVDKLAAQTEGLSIQDGGFLSTLKNFTLFGINPNSSAGVLNTYEYSNGSISILKETGNYKEMQKTQLASAKPVSTEGTAAKETNATKLKNMKRAANGDVAKTRCIKNEAMAVVKNTPAAPKNDDSPFSTEIMSKTLAYINTPEFAKIQKTGNTDNLPDGIRECYEYYQSKAMSACAAC